MKRFLTFVTMLLLAVPAFGGIAYDLTMTTTTGEGKPSTMKAVTKVEGSGMRMEIAEGENQMFRSGSVILSHDGGSSMLVLNPAEKTYYELSVDKIFNQLTTMMQSMGSNFDMSIENQKVDVKELGSGGVINGYKTSKYQIDASYDIRMSMMGMNMNMEVESSTLMWTTPKISKENASFFQSKGLKTGMENLDELIAKYAAKVKGFPLRTEADSNMVMMGRSNKSKTVTEVTNVRESKIPASEFEVPSGYEKVDSPLESMMNKRH